MQEGGATINNCADTECPNVSTIPEHHLADVLSAISASGHVNCPPPSYADATDVDALPSYQSLAVACACETQRNVPKSQSKSRCGCMRAICRYILWTIFSVLVILFMCFYYFIKNCPLTGVF